MYPSVLQTLIENLRKLPGVGAKTAERYAFALLNLSDEEIQTMANALIQSKSKLHFCSVCGNITDKDKCSICVDDKRDHTTICVVQDVKDVVAIERIKQFNGVYHVLHGVISTSKGIMPDDLSIEALLLRTNTPVEEIILATNPTVEGEMTALYLAKRLENKVGKITRLAHGLPMGAHMDYAD
ncbi:MAG TPA: recombination mediator RecR, partial [Erysipelotrichaceae bacterium]|nr:recombination mediator RecR [Erysipelotrichaceae bacterium]